VISKTAHSGGTHPLEMMPVFRRWPPSPLRDLVYTGIWNTLLAILLVIIHRFFRASPESFLHDLYPVLVISNLIGYMIHVAMLAVPPLLRRWPAFDRAVPRVAVQIVLIGLCVVAGIVLGSALLRGENPLQYLERGAILLPLLPFALLTGVLMIGVFTLGDRRIAQETLALRQSEQIASAAQMVAEARLRSLQAQIEPHFLYNTLANVLGLIDTDPATARHMLERFIDYLRASLAASRADTATLGAELDLVAAYLDVLAVRMGPRLRYRFEVEEGCRDIVIAPMLLQPVVENAVSHGLEPKVEGGTINVRAFRRDAQLWIEVSDTGAGLGASAPKPGGGVGLSNLRARLRSLHDGAAQVQLLENQPCGITLRIMLPLKEPSH
jgi:signal transduction histidine kinase